MILEWRHSSGFSIHNEVRIKPDDDKGIENLSQYIIRNAFSLKKLKFEEGDSSVIYRSKMTHGKNKRNFPVFSDLEILFLEFREGTYPSKRGFSFGIYCGDNTTHPRAIFSIDSDVWLVL